MAAKHNIVVLFVCTILPNDSFQNRIELEAVIGYLVQY